MATGQLRKVRVRLTALTGGSIVPTFTSDELPSMHPNVAAQRAGTLAATAVSASVGAAATATLAAVTGLRHYVDFVAVTRSAAALLTAGATPATVTTTNIAGSPALTFGSDAAAQGVDTTREIDFGSSGMAATAAGAATTVVCPATPNVIWRVTVAYRLGL
jgi:hypothetical protein